MNKVTLRKYEEHGIRWALVARVAKRKLGIDNLDYCEVAKHMKRVFKVSSSSDGWECSSEGFDHFNAVFSSKVRAIIYAVEMV